MGWITAGAGAWHPLPAEVTDSLNVTYSGYTSPAYGGDGRIFIHGTARVPEPESCETCWVMRPVIWSGSALSGELEATARSAAPASPRGR